MGTSLLAFVDREVDPAEFFHYLIAVTLIGDLRPNPYLVSILPLTASPLRDQDRTWVTKGSPDEAFDQAKARLKTLHPDLHLRTAPSS